MPLPTFEEFTSKAKVAGFDEVIERRWAPDQVVPEHAHDFDADAVMTEGELWLTCGGSTRHLKPGDTFALSRGQRHAERYGPTGGVYWVARRNPPKV